MNTWHQKVDWLKRLVAAGASGADMQVAQALAFYTFSAVDYTERSRAELSEVTGLSTRSITRSLARLEEAGAAFSAQTKRRGGRRGKNRVTLVFGFSVGEAASALGKPNARSGSESPPWRKDTERSDEHREPPVARGECVRVDTGGSRSASHPWLTVLTQREDTQDAKCATGPGLPPPLPESQSLSPSRKPLPADPRALPASVIALPAKPGETREPTPDDLRFLAELAARRERLLSKPPASPASAR